MRSESDRNTERIDGTAENLSGVPPAWQLMAQQLSREADELASIYPPKSDAVEELAAHVGSARVRRVRSPLWVASAAVVVVAVGIAASSYVRMSSAPEPIETLRPGGPSLVAEGGETSVDMGPIVSPVMFVSEMSDPELEAWLDLQQDQGNERVAF